VVLSLNKREDLNRLIRPGLKGEGKDKYQHSQHQLIIIKKEEKGGKTKGERGGTPVLLFIMERKNWDVLGKEKEIRHPFSSRGREKEGDGRFFYN